MTKRDKLRFGLIGTGLAGPLFGGALRDLPDAELVAVATTREETARAFAAKYDVKQCYADWRRMLEQADIDAVCVASPTHLHAPMVLAAAALGKHVITEKPIGRNLDEADAMISACERANVRFAVIFMYRFMDSALIMKRAIDEGRLGRLILGDCRVKFLRSQAYYESGPWRGKWATEGGGCLPTNASHTMDLLFWMMGDVESVAGCWATLGHTIEVEDTAVASLRFRNGALGQILASTAIKPGYPRVLEITGEHGTIALEDDNIAKLDVEGDAEGPAILETYRRRESADVTHSRPAFVSSELHRRQLRDFIDAIREGRPPRVDGSEGRKTVEIIRAIYQAADTGTFVRLPVVERSVGPATTGTLAPIAA